jgi:hypothetical protein
MQSCDDERKSRLSPSQPPGVLVETFLSASRSGHLTKCAPLRAQTILQHDSPETHGTEWFGEWS